MALPPLRHRFGRICLASRRQLETRLNEVTLRYFDDRKAGGEIRSMADPIVEALVLDLLHWLTAGDRTYDQVLDAWRTYVLAFPSGRMQTIAALSEASIGTAAHL
jgi:hypothetical protein